jgi:glutaryl-CoA dehydrogenase (non-decarboxylating)
MIDFELTEDHKALVQTVREFAQKEVAPHIKEWDEKQHFQPSVLKNMAALNLLGVCIPEEYGGAGFDYISLGLVCEELEAVDTFLRVVMSVHTGLNSLTLYTWGTEEQKQKYLAPQARGEKLATYGLTEPGAGSDVVGARSTARREGNEWVLNGEDRRREATQARPHRNVVFYRRAQHEGVLVGNDSREDGHSCRQHRILLIAGRARAAGEHGW